MDKRSTTFNWHGRCKRITKSYKTYRIFQHQENGRRFLQHAMHNGQSKPVNNMSVRIRLVRQMGYCAIYEGGWTGVMQFRPSVTFYSAIRRSSIDIRIEGDAQKLTLGFWNAFTIDCQYESFNKTEKNCSRFPLLSWINSYFLIMVCSSFACLK